MKQRDYLINRTAEFMEDLDPITKEILQSTIKLVQERNLSVEAFAKKVDRDIDRILRSPQKRGSGS